MDGMKTLPPSRIILEETFYVLTKKNCVFRVRLTTAGLCLIKESDGSVKEQLIPLEDIVGCRCLRSKKQGRRCSCQSIPSGDPKVVEEGSGDSDDTDVSAYLYIYAYVLVTKGTTRKRERTIVTLRFRSFDKYEDNYKEAQRWRTAVKRLVKGDSAAMGPTGDFSLSNKYKEERRLLVLCNPKSGPGKGRSIFQDKVAPVLQEAEIPYDLHMTKHANYAREFIRTSNIFQWTGILLVGGDGIVFEAVNGLFERWDWSEAVKAVPLGVVPGGSGNGLARSIAHHSDEPYDASPALVAALAAVRRHRHPMDLVRVETTSQIAFSFLSVGWGLLSDIDIESERLRVLGGQRFNVWSLARLIGLRSYRGRLWYLPAAEDEQRLATAAAAPTGEGKALGGSSVDLAGDAVLETQEGRQRLDSWYSAASRRSAYFSATGSSYQSTANSVEATPVGTATRPRTYGPAPQIPALVAPVPATWRLIAGSFVMVHASYQTHLGEECLFAPEARLHDGLIWLLIVRAGATRAQLLHFMLGFSTGRHTAASTPGGTIELVPVRAFRIEPDPSESGYMTVDGEHVEYGPIQAEIFPGLAQVMVP